jgi:hypothetical protein
MLLLPLHAVWDTVALARAVDRPLRATRNCLLDLSNADATLRRGIYQSDPFDRELSLHQFQYYLRPVGTWASGTERFDTEIRMRLTEPDEQTPILLSNAHWQRVATTPFSDAAGPSGAAALQVTAGAVLLLPGPYQPCAAPAVREGATLIAQTPPAPRPSGEAPD